MKAFNISILAADKNIYQGPCESVNVPTPDGLYGILAGHINMIVAVAPGQLTYRVPGGEDIYVAVSEGILKVENGEVLVLTDTAELPDEIDLNRAKHALDDAQEEILQNKSMHEYALAQAELARAMGRLKVGRKRDKK